MERYGQPSLQEFTKVEITNIPQDVLANIDLLERSLITELGAVDFRVMTLSSGKLFVIADFASEEAAQDVIQCLHEKPPYYMSLSFFRNLLGLKAPLRKENKLIPVSQIARTAAAPVRGLGRGRFALETSSERPARGVGACAVSPECHLCARAGSTFCDDCQTVFCSYECFQRDMEHSHFCKPHSSPLKQGPFHVPPPPLGSGPFPGNQVPQQQLRPVSYAGPVPPQFVNSPPHGPEPLSMNRGDYGYEPPFPGPQGSYNPNMMDPRDAGPMYPPGPSRQGLNPMMNTGPLGPPFQAEGRGPIGPYDGGRANQQQGPPFQAEGRGLIGPYDGGRANQQQGPPFQAEGRGLIGPYDGGRTNAQSGGFQHKNQDRFHVPEKPFENSKPQNKPTNFSTEGDKSQGLLPTPSAHPRDQDGSRGHFNQQQHRSSGGGSLTFQRCDQQPFTANRNRDGGAVPRDRKDSQTSFGRTQQHRGFQQKSPGKSGEKNLQPRAAASATATMEKDWDDEDAEVPVAYGKAFTGGVVELPQGPVQITVAAIYTPDVIYIQINSLEDKLYDIANKIDASLKKAPRLEDPTVGLACVALFQGSWYRGKIRKILDGGSAVVFFVDYGNTDEVELKDVKQLQQDLCGLPLYAIAVQLVNIQPVKEKWDLAADALIENYAAKEPLILEVVGRTESGKPLVEMRTPSGKTLNDVLVKEGLARPTAAKMEEKQQIQQEAPPKPSEASEKLASRLLSVLKISEPAAEIPKPEKEPVVESVAGITKFRPIVSGDVCIVSAVGLNDIYVQCVAGELVDELGKITEVLEEGNMANRPKLSAASVKEGSFYACLFADDSNWYRAQVIAKNGDTFQVRFIDFGNSTEVTVNELRLLPPELLAIPPCCGRVTLDGVELTSEVPEEIRATLDEFVEQKAEMVVVSTDESGVPSVRITLNSVSLNDTINSKLTAASAIATQDSEVEAPASAANDDWEIAESFYDLMNVCNLPVNEEVDAMILNSSEAPSLVHVCRFDEEQFRLLAELQDEINRYCESPRAPYSPKHLELCLVKNTDDLWYRSFCIVQEDGNKYFCVDSGEEIAAAADSVVGIPKKFLQLQYLAQWTVIKGFEDQEDVDEGTVQKLKDLLPPGQLTKMTMVAKTENLGIVLVPAVDELIRNGGPA